MDDEKRSSKRQLSIDVRWKAILHRSPPPSGCLLADRRLRAPATRTARRAADSREHEDGSVHARILLRSDNPMGTDKY